MKRPHTYTYVVPTPRPTSTDGPSYAPPPDGNVLEAGTGKRDHPRLHNFSVYTRIFLSTSQDDKKYVISQ